MKKNITIFVVLSVFKLNNNILHIIQPLNITTALALLLYWLHFSDTFNAEANFVVCAEPTRNFEMLFSLAKCTLSDDCKYIVSSPFYFSILK